MSFRKYDCGTNKWFFSSDFHIQHSNILKFTGRPFQTIQENDDTIIENINQDVGENDNFVIAGDFIFGNPLPYLKRIKCKNLYFVVGSHDKSMWDVRHMFKFFGDKLQLEVEGELIVVTHCPHLCWEKSHYGSWNLFGHLHSGKSPKGCEAEWDDTKEFPAMSLFDKVIAKGKMIDIGVDGHDFRPWSFWNIKDVMDTKEGFLVKRDRKV